MSASNARGAGRIVAVAAILLAVLHQDLWFWDDTTMVMGFLPIGLLYHGIYSLVAGVLWLMAVRFAWPHRLEEWADEFDEAPGDAPARTGDGA